MLSKDVVVLAVGQALTGMVTSLLTSVSSLSGVYLAPDASLATVPVTATVLGTLLMIYPASSLMGRLGRRGGFMVKAGVGIVGGVVCTGALVAASFTLLIVGTFLLGVFSAFGQYYRFAAIDAAATPRDRTSAVAIVTGAGVFGGMGGPWLASEFAESLPAAPYAGAFVALACVCVCLALSQCFLSSTLGRGASAAPASGARSSFAFSAEFAKASAICAIAFSAMTLTMNGAPLAIHQSGHSLSVSSGVLQLHFALMYLPSFINPFLVQRVGLRGLVVLGGVATAAGCILAVLPVQSLGLYFVELGLSGMGWNFMFNGGTLLVADTYPAAAKDRAQGLNSLVVYGANLVASFLAGVLVASEGWWAANLVSLPLLLIALVVLRPRAAAEPILRQG